MTSTCLLRTVQYRQDAVLCCTPRGDGDGSTNRSHRFDEPRGRRRGGGGGRARAHLKTGWRRPRELCVQITASAAASDHDALPVAVEAASGGGSGDGNGNRRSARGIGGSWALKTWVMGWWGWVVGQTQTGAVSRKKERSARERAGGSLWAGVGSGRK